MRSTKRLKVSLTACARLIRARMSARDACLANRSAEPLSIRSEGEACLAAASEVLGFSTLRWRALKQIAFFRNCAASVADRTDPPSRLVQRATGPVVGLGKEPLLRCLLVLPVFLVLALLFGCLGSGGLAAAPALVFTGHVGLSPVERDADQAPPSHSLRRRWRQARRERAPRWAFI